MTFESRLLLYVLAVVIGTIIMVTLQIADSNRAYEEGDRSARAWMAFLPYLIPVFIAYAAAYVAPVAIVTEASLAIYRRYFND